MTPEQRERHAFCGAKRKNGEPCKQFAGTGTDHPGIGRCRIHGGTAPTHNQHAAMVEARREISMLAEPLPDDLTSHQQLKWLSNQIGGHVRDLLGDPELRNLSTPVAQAKFRLTMEQVDRAARLAKQCAEAGVDEAETHVREGQALLMANQVKAAAEEAGLNDMHVRALGAALRKRAAEASGDYATASQADAQLQRLLDQIQAEDERRIERLAKKEAERLSGLTLPPEEWVTEQPEDPARDLALGREPEDRKHP